MKLYTFEATQLLPITIDEAWTFFSDASKLPVITPPWMHFTVTGTLADKVHAGMIATYRLKPLLGIPVQWVTEITHVVEGKLFVDEQRFGPYRFWHHQHHFSPVEDGVEMRDIVHYALPFGIIGRMAHFLNVETKLKQIFQFRKEKLEEIFPEKSIDP